MMAPAPANSLRRRWGPASASDTPTKGWPFTPSSAIRFDFIAEIDLYKFDPWDLPGLSRLQTQDLEWYFFTALDRKYCHGSKTNWSTGQGYWKTTGKDNPVFHQSRIVGMKMVLVKDSGWAPHGQRTNWVMHEYRLEDENLSHSGNPQVTQKSASGPKNGEQYGAPFIEVQQQSQLTA